MLTYAYRIGREAVLLNDAQWEEIAPLLEHRLRGIMDYRKQTGCSIAEARAQEPMGQCALDRYEELTGIRLDHPDQRGLRICDYGSLCPKCARPFRTLKARFCAECGFTLPPGVLAGPLEVGIS